MSAQQQFVALYNRHTEKTVKNFAITKKRIIFAVANKNRTAKVAQLVEHNLAKVRVAGSNPVFRSKGDSCHPSFFEKNCCNLKLIFAATNALHRW